MHGAIGPFDVEEIDDLGKVALVGAGMRSHPGVTARMFRTLADEQINLRMISTSPITISCLIPRNDIQRAVRALAGRLLARLRLSRGCGGSPPAPRAARAPGSPR